MKSYALAFASCALLLAGCTQTYTAPQGSGFQQGQQPPSQQAPLTGTAGPMTRIGPYMDRHEADLRARLRVPGVIVARRGDVLVVTIQDAQLFKGLALRSDGSALLQTLAQVLAYYDHTQIDIASYTDTTGTPEQNLAVSEKRAERVAGALQQDGVAASRISAKGYGEADPKYSDGADPRNRRIDLRISPKPA